MAKSIFEIDGFPELQAKIKKLANDKDKRREIIKILRRSARSTVLLARSIAPKEKGYVELRGKRYSRKDYVSGVGSKSINTEVMRRSKNPMIIVGPRSKGKYDGWYVRQFVIPGHNIYRSGFKRDKRGSDQTDINRVRERNALGAKSRVAPNFFMNKAENATQGKVRTDAIASMEKFIQKRIDQL